MAKLTDAGLRFWIILAKRAIQFLDDGGFRSLRRKTVASTDPTLAQSQRTCLRIPTEHGELEAVLAVPRGGPTAGVLVFHGIGDRLSYWEDVQALLALSGIASLIFHYPDYGRSTGIFSVQGLRSASSAAYAALQANIPLRTPVFLLGFSMGTGIATDAACYLDREPNGLILCQPFRSLREGTVEVVRSRLVARLMPDVWRTVETVSDLPMPLLVVHSDGDKLFPTHHGLSVYEAARSGLAITVAYSSPSGFEHNQVYLRPSLGYWQPILDFMARIGQT